MYFLSCLENLLTKLFCAEIHGNPSPSGVIVAPHYLIWHPIVFQNKYNNPFSCLYQLFQFFGLEKKKKHFEILPLDYFTSNGLRLANDKRHKKKLSMIKSLIAHKKTNDSLYHDFLEKEQVLNFQLLRCAHMWYYGIVTAIINELDFTHGLQGRKIFHTAWQMLLQGCYSKLYLYLYSHLKLQALSLLGTELVCTVTDSRTPTVPEFSC